MTAALFPAFEHFPREASIIGDLLTGYSAIEYQLCMCAGMGGGNVSKAITELFSKRGETPRVKRANRLGGAAYAAAGLGQEFDTAIDDILHCVRIRNQYAHCIWHEQASRLVFAHMEEIAAPNGSAADTRNLTFFAVDVDLLREQKKFFFFVKDNLNYLNYKRRQTVGSDVGASAHLRVPMLISRPPMHL
jgi:hypothetical protein